VSFYQNASVIADRQKMPRAIKTLAFRSATRLPFAGSCHAV
jgi:hypothetical protein